MFNNGYGHWHGDRPLVNVISDTCFPPLLLHLRDKGILTSFCKHVCHDCRQMWAEHTSTQAAWIPAHPSGPSQEGCAVWSQMLALGILESQGVALTSDQNRMHIACGRSPNSFTTSASHRIELEAGLRCREDPGRKAAEWLFSLREQKISVSEHDYSFIMTFYSLNCIISKQLISLLAVQDNGAKLK